MFMLNVGLPWCRVLSTLCRLWTEWCLAATTKLRLPVSRGLDEACSPTLLVCTTTAAAVHVMALRRLWVTSWCRVRSDLMCRVSLLLALCCRWRTACLISYVVLIRTS